MYNGPDSALEECTMLYNGQESALSLSSMKRCHLDSLTSGLPISACRLHSNHEERSRTRTGWKHDSAHFFSVQCKPNCQHGMVSMVQACDCQDAHAKTMQILSDASVSPPSYPRMKSASGARSIFGPEISVIERVNGGN